jgi:hypothetical protein
MSVPSLTAEAALYRTHQHYGDYALQVGRPDRQAVGPQAPWTPSASNRCRYGECLPDINCIDHGGGIYDCFVESYKRLRCCFPASPIWGEACHYTSDGCPPGHAIRP